MLGVADGEALPRRARRKILKVLDVQITECRARRASLVNQSRIDKKNNNKQFAVLAVSPW